jgi:hypothetical protein
MAKRRGMNFERMLDKGEGPPNDVIAQTPNGTARSRGAGWNRVEPYTGPQVSPTGAWSGNRSGE